MPFAIGPKRSRQEIFLAAFLLDALTQHHARARSIVKHEEAVFLEGGWRRGSVIGRWGASSRMAAASSGVGARRLSAALGKIFQVPSASDVILPRSTG